MNSTARETFEEGKFYDANAPMLRGLIAACGAEAIDMGVLPDTAFFATP